MTSFLGFLNFGPSEAFSGMTPMSSCIWKSPLMLISGSNHPEKRFPREIRSIHSGIDLFGVDWEKIGGVFHGESKYQHALRSTIRRKNGMFRLIGSCFLHLRLDILEEVEEHKFLFKFIAIFPESPPKKKARQDERPYWKEREWTTGVGLAFERRKKSGRRSKWVCKF